MTPHPARPGAGTTLIDVGLVLLVLLILGVLGVLLLIACRTLAAGVRAAVRWRRPGRWPGRGRR